MRILKILILIAVGSFNLNADTKDLFYIGSAISLETSSTYKYKEKPLLGGQIKAGYLFNENLALELRGGKSLASQKKLEHSYSINLFLKPMYKVSNELKLTTLLGYGQHKLLFKNEKDFNGVTDNQTTQNAFSYGLGVEYNLNQKLSSSLEWVQLIDKQHNQYAINIQGVYLGLTYYWKL